MHHVIIAGAAGFIGSAAAEEFLREGWRVTALVHRRPPADEARWRGNPRLRLLRGSITDPALLQRLSQAIEAAGGSCQAIVNCAGRASDVGRDRTFRTANLAGVENLCACVRRLPIGRLVQISTTDVYGVGTCDGADETTPLRNNRHNPYPKYKILAERAIARLLEPTRYTILRPGLVWGPGDTTVLPRALAFLRRSPVILHFGRWHGTNRWPLAYVGNVARMIRVVATCDDALGEAFNVVDPETTTMDQYYRMLLETFLPDQADKRAITLPFWVGAIAARVSTLLSNAMNLDHPLFDPSYYSLCHIAHDQHFLGGKAAALAETQGVALVNRDAALCEFKAWNAEAAPVR